MKTEIIDGSTCYTEIYTDEDGRTWNVLQREAGSLSVYYTRGDVSAHYVVFDTLDDDAKPTAQAEAVVGRLIETAFAGLLQAVKLQLRQSVVRTGFCAQCGKKIEDGFFGAASSGDDERFDSLACFEDFYQKKKEGN